MILIVGGGPVGLFLGRALCRRGHEVLVAEARALPADKCCGEGLMPTGLASLRRYGVDPVGMPFTGIGYHAPNGRQLQADFAEGPGRGVRRLELEHALLAGVDFEVRAQARVRLLERTREGILADVGGDKRIFRLVIGADGLGSAVRGWAGLDGPPAVRRRWGARQHFRGTPPRRVEVYWQDRREAYVTPVGPDTVGVALLWERQGPTTYEGALDHFPAVRMSLGEPVSEVAMMGPLERRTRGVIAPGVALVGDAAGYLDAITGEGLSLGFAQAEALADCVPAGTGLVPPLWDYQRRYRRLVRPYYHTTRLALALSRRPWAVNLLARLLPSRGLQLLLSYSMS